MLKRANDIIPTGMRNTIHTRRLLQMPSSDQFCIIVLCISAHTLASPNFVHAKKAIAANSKNGAV